MTDEKKKVVIPAKKRIPDKDITEEYVLEKEQEFLKVQKEALDIIYRMRMMNTSDLQRALGYKSYPKLMSLLKRLHEQRFLDRKQRPVEVREQGEREIYHMLDLAGAMFIRNYYGCEKLADVKWTPRENSVKYDYALHSLKIGTVYSRLEEAAREKNGKVMDALCDKHLFIKYYYGKEYFFYPDMFFKYAQDNKISGFFVEVDMGTMAMQGTLNTVSFDKKVFYYENYREHGGNHFGLQKMPRVLVLTTTKERAESLASVVKAKQDEMNKHGVEFLFSFFALWEKDPFGKIFIDTSYKDTPTPKIRTMFD